MVASTPLEAATLTALHVNTCPLWLFPTLYVKSDVTVYVSLAVLWMDRSVASYVTSFCPIVHCNVALGRLPVVVQVTSSGVVSSMLSTFPVMVGWSGLTEIVCILFTKCMALTFGRTLNYKYKTFGFHGKIKRIKTFCHLPQH